jgi:exosortase H (IPTLxxWG-CTERM-specific)
MARQTAKRQRAKKKTTNLDPIVTVKNRNAFRFSVGFALACIGLYAIIHILPESFTLLMNEHVARTLGLVLNAFGIHAVTLHDTVSENGLVFKIIPECTPIFTAGLFIVFVVFYPSSMLMKAAGLAMGIPALYLGNLFRLVATFLVSRNHPQLFDLFHVYLGQIFTLLLILLCCLVWMKWADREKAEPKLRNNTGGFFSRFALISGILFFAWIRVQHAYIGVLDQFMIFGFSLFGVTTRLAHESPVYYETFSIVIVASLVFAAKPLPWKRRAQLLGAGLGTLFIIHLFHRIDNALMAFWGNTAIQLADLTLLMIGQFMVPVLLLIHFEKLQTPLTSAASA